MHDLAIVIVSTNEGHWLRPCLSSVFEHGRGIELDVVVADNESTDETRAVVGEFQGARTVSCRNKGFAHANNRGYVTTDARYVLFLNPDTEILQGTFAELVRALDERPSVGLVGVRQVDAENSLAPTIRRFPNALRALGDALASERWPVAAGAFGERVLDAGSYEREVSCDWTSGSFMLARREALESAGLMDERFFIFSEEPDLCYRIKQAGWDVRHVPWMTILHHVNKAGIKPKLEAQDAFARMQHARKHFSRAAPGRLCGRTGPQARSSRRRRPSRAQDARHSPRGVVPRVTGGARARRAAVRSAPPTGTGTACRHCRRVRRLPR